MRDRDTLAKLAKRVGQPKPASVQPGTQAREKLKGIFHIPQFSIPWASQGEMSHALSPKVPFLPVTLRDRQTGTQKLNARLPFRKNLHREDTMDREMKIS